MMLKEQLLDECRDYIDILIGELTDLPSGEKGRERAALMLWRSMKKSGEREPLNTPILMVAKYLRAKGAPVAVSQLRRELPLPAATIRSMIARHEWKHVIGGRRVKAPQPTVFQAVPSPAATPAIPVEVQDSQVKSLILRVAGVEITINYQQKETPP